MKRGSGSLGCEKVICTAGGRQHDKSTKYLVIKKQYTKRKNGYNYCSVKNILLIKHKMIHFHIVKLKFTSKTTKKGFKTYAMQHRNRK